MVGRGAEVTFPLFGTPVAEMVGGVEVIDDPLPGQRRRIETAGSGELAELGDAVIGQPQSIHGRSPGRPAPLIPQIGISGALGVLCLDRNRLV